MTLLHKVLEEKFHKMSGLMHVLQFCGDELQSIENQIPSSHQLYLKKLTQELARLKETFEEVKSFHTAYEGYERQKNLKNLIRLAEASFLHPGLGHQIELKNITEADILIDLAPGQTHTVILVLKFLSFINQSNISVWVSAAGDELFFELPVESNFANFDAIFEAIEAQRLPSSPDYQENIKPLVLRIIGGYFNELSLFFLNKSSNLFIQLKVKL